MPLVHAPGAEPPEPVSELHARARKIKPQYTEGELIRVAGASNQAEAEFIQGMLLEEGVPSLVRRSAGFDVPDFMAGGPRDILVAASGAATAREVLVEADIVSAGPPSAALTPAPLRLLAGLLLGVVVVGLLLFLATHAIAARGSNQRCSAWRARWARQAPSVWISARPSNVLTSSSLVCPWSGA